MKLRKFFISLGVSICALLLVTTSISVAWFNSQVNNITYSKNIDGSLLEGYFHCGNGQIDHPFVITRPKHWENLVKLHHKMSGFSTSGFYFQVGYGIDESEPSVMKVFDYKDDGTINTATVYSKTLNVKSLGYIEPLGGETHPFTADIDGNDITIKNIQIKGSSDPTDDSYYDIGIFGYVGARYVNDEIKLASIKNLYFDSVTINVENTVDASGAAERDFHKAHEGKIYTGYLCGHVYDVNSFQHCYLTNPKIQGVTNGYSTVNNYGYIGMVEIDNEGKSAGIGGNYEFTLNSSAIHDYFSNYYDNNATYNDSGTALIGLKDTKMRARNTEYTSSIGTSKAFTDGLAYEDDTQWLGSAYRLKGNYFKGAGTISGEQIVTDHNYSLSTLGYQGTKIEDVKTKYEVYYSNYGVETVPDSTAQVTTYDQFKQQNSGYYYFYDDGTIPGTTNYTQTPRWTYYYSNNTVTKYDFTLNFSQLSFTNSYVGTYINEVRDIYLVVDDVLYQGTQTSAIDPSKFTYDYSVTTSGSYTSGKGTITLNLHPIKLNLGIGTHYVSFLFNFLTARTASYVRRCCSWYHGTLNSDGSVSPSSFTVDESHTSTTKAFTNASSPSVYQARTESAVKFNIKPENLTMKSPDIIPNVGNLTKSYPIIGYKLDPRKKIKTGEKSALFAKTTNFTYDNEVFLVHAESSERVLVQGQTTEVYIADDPAITSSGYNAKCIDIVGGGVVFGTNYVSLNAGKNGFPDTQAAVLNDRFYATKYCPNSIVMYVRKSTSESCGTIEINYSTLGALVSVKMKTPTFKKGPNTYYDLNPDHYGTYDPEDPKSVGYYAEENGTNRYISLHNLTQSQLECSSFCALDDSNNICAVYDSSGNPTSGSNESKIQTYVLALGVQHDDVWWKELFSGVDTRTRITSIHFEYESEAGYSGNLGSIDYRTYPEKGHLIDEVYYNVFTFYYVTNLDEITYLFTVSYNSETHTYTLTATSSDDLEMQICIYVSGYTVVFQDTSQSESETFTSVGNHLVYVRGQT